MTRTFAFAVALVLASSHLAEAQSAGDAVFAGTQVHTINLRFPRADYWDSLTVYYAQGNEQYIKAHAVIDNVAYDSIAVRLKGNSSYTYPNNKKSFRLAFDEFVGTRKWDGLKGVHLNNMWGDPSFMREKLHLDFCREAGIAAPRGNYARLLVNDTLFAFYSLVEHVDKTLLDTRFANKAGDLFKAVDGIGDSDSLLSDFAWYGSDTATYASRYELKTDGSVTAWHQLLGFIDTLHHASDAAAVLAAKADLPQVYKAFAADNLFGNLDSYLNSGRNFYVYFHSKTGKLKWVVWDAGLSFGAYGGGVSSPENMNVAYIVNPDTRPLFGKIVSTPSLKTAYLQTLCELSSQYFRTDRLFPHIDSVAAIIRPFVNEDKRKMYTAQQFESNISNDINAGGGGSVRKPGIKSFLTKRIASVQTQLAALGISCATEVESPASAPAQLLLAQNYPNPFTGSTTITYLLPATGAVTITVHDALGRNVLTLVDRNEAAGLHSAVLDARALPSGMYRCVLAQGSLRSTRTMVVRH